MALAWVTGAGTGIGRAVSLELARRGWIVAASSRTESRLGSLAEEAAKLGGSVIPMALDVTLRDSVDVLVHHIENEIGPIDLAVLNAGTYVQFGASEFSVEAFQDQFDLNVMGTVNCANPVLKFMRDRESGHIAVVSSLTAYRGIPFASAYGATKAALTNMCEALKPELEQFGVDISVIHPGFVKTPLTDQNEFPMPFLMEANDAARRIVDGLERRKFEVTFPRRFAFLLKLARCLPYSLYFAITRRLVKQ
tara:strand:- start:7878 stop:8630 length:753 start_codon:yes stop_codon:yes gene_type:complete